MTIWNITQIADYLVIWELMTRKSVNIQYRHRFPPSVFNARWVEPMGVGSMVSEPSSTRFQSCVLYTVFPSMLLEKAGPETFLSCPDTL